MNAREIAITARRRIGEPNFESVTRQQGYDIVWAQQQELVTHARRSYSGWYVKTATVDITGESNDYPIGIADFGGIYVATYDPAEYPNYERGEIDVVPRNALDQYEGSATAEAVSPGFLSAISTFDDGTGTRIEVRPLRRSAKLQIQYIPSHVVSQTPDGSPPLIQAFHSTLLTVAVALEMLMSAKWDYDPDYITKRASYTDSSNANNLSVQYERLFRQYDHYVHQPFTRSTTFAARPFGWRRRGGLV